MQRACCLQDAIQFEVSQVTHTGVRLRWRHLFLLLLSICCTSSRPADRLKDQCDNNSVCGTTATTSRRIITAVTAFMLLVIFATAPAGSPDVKSSKKLKEFEFNSVAI